MMKIYTDEISKH